MSKTAIIAVIPKPAGRGKSVEASLAAVGRTRFPGTGVMIFPFRENDGTFRTALDPDCVIYRKIEDPVVRKAKQDAARELLEALEAKTRLPLGSKSPFYNFGFESRGSDGQKMKVTDPYKLIDGDNIFNLYDPETGKGNPYDSITYAWVSVHPKIASSLEAWNQGVYPSDTQFYVKDKDVETAELYAKKKVFTDAIIKFNSFSPDKKKKIARLCDLPAYENTREELVFNMMDDFLNSKELQQGAFKGRPGVAVFNLYAGLDDDSLSIKDLVEQGFKNLIFRVKRGGTVYEGEQQMFKSKDELIEHYLDPKNQDDVLALTKKLKIKQLASV